MPNNHFFILGLGKIFFDEESIYEISKPSFKFFLNGRTNRQTNGQAESNMLPTFSKLGA